MVSIFSIYALKYEAEQLRKRHWNGERGLGLDFVRLANKSKLNAKGSHKKWLALAGVLYAECCLITVYSNPVLAQKAAQFAETCLEKAECNTDRKIGFTLLALWRGLERAQAGDWPTAQKILCDLEELAHNGAGKNGRHLPETMEGRAWMRLRAIISLKAWGEEVAIENLTDDYARFGRKRLEGYIKTWPDIGAPLPESFPSELMPALLKARGG